MEGPITLQEFARTGLFRICIHHNNSELNKGVLCLPPDEMFSAHPPKKLISPTGKKALESVVTLEGISPEGYKTLTFTLPYDGNNGASMTFCEALVYAAQVVSHNVWKSSRQFFDGTMHYCHRCTIIDQQSIDKEEDNDSHESAFDSLTLP